MKKAIVCLVFASSSLFALAQTTPVPAQGKLFLGVGSGIANSSTGIFGLRFDARVGDKVILGVGAGISSWGPKVSFSAYYQTASNWCPMITIGSALGADSIPLSQELVDGTTKTVDMKLDPVNSLSLGVEKQWFTKRGNRFYLDLGYAISFAQSKPFRTLDPTEKLSVNSDRIMQVIAPGGIVIGFGYSFRLN